MKREPISLELFHAKFDCNMRFKIESLKNSCGVITIYILSLMYGIDFDFDYWQKSWNGTGLTTREIINYLESKGLNAFYISGMRHNVEYAHMRTLFENGITVMFSGCFIDSVGLPYNHVSVLNYDRELIYAETKNKKIETAKHIDMLVFFSKDKDISDFVKFTII